MVHQLTRRSIGEALLSRLIYYIFTGGVMGGLLVFIDGWWSVQHHLPQLLSFEIPLMIMTLELGYVSQRQRWGLTLILPLIPLLISYLLFEQFFNFLARTPRPSDIQNAHLIFEVSVPLGVGFIMVIALVPISIGMIGWTLYKSHHPDTPRAQYAVKGLIIILMLVMYHSDTFQRYHADRYVYVPWSEKTTIKTNGRLSSFLFYKHQEAQSRLKLNAYRAREVNVGEALFSAPPKVTPNIHMIVLESFIDPRRLNGTYSPDPLGPKLQPFLLPYNDGFSRVYSPVYGGGTAQAEFELLTGVKALSRVNSIEFNVMRGASSRA